MQLDETFSPGKRGLCLVSIMSRLRLKNTTRPKLTDLFCDREGTMVVVFDDSVLLLCRTSGTITIV